MLATTSEIECILWHHNRWWNRHMCCLCISLL